MGGSGIGDNVRLLRRRRGLTQVQLAAAAGVPVLTLRGWEYGRREPLVSAAARLAEALGVTVEELLAPRADVTTSVSPPEPRRRGRPRKPPAVAQDASAVAPEADAPPTPPKRPQGRRRG